MAKKDRPAHGGLSFHKCGDDYLIALHDSNGEAFAHCAMDSQAAGALAGAIIHQLQADLDETTGDADPYNGDPPPAPPPPAGFDYSGNRLPPSRPNRRG
jgi:hypothetical protein